MIPFLDIVSVVLATGVVLAVIHYSRMQVTALRRRAERAERAARAMRRYAVEAVTIACMEDAPSPALILYNLSQSIDRVLIDSMAHDPR